MPEVKVASVTLNKTNASLIVGEMVALTATINPSDATDKSVTWNSNNTGVATVSNGVVKAISPGTATIRVTAGGKNATCAVKVTNPLSSSAATAVNLGLSVKWASYNIGATKPEDFGDYFAWGEIDPYYKTGYAQSNSPVWKSGYSAGYFWPS